MIAIKNVALVVTLLSAAAWAPTAAATTAAATTAAPTTAAPTTAAPTTAAATTTCTVNIANGGTGTASYTSDCKSTDVLANEYCTLSCSTPGYSGKSRIKCFSDGNFDTTVAPTCTPTSCNSIPNGGTGALAYTSDCADSVIASGSSCTLTCSAPGRVGSSEIPCLAGKVPEPLNEPKCAISSLFFKPQKDDLTTTEFTLILSGCGAIATAGVYYFARTSADPNFYVFTPPNPTNAFF